MDLYLSNFHKEPIEVRHSELEQVDEIESPFRSKCPKCGLGFLMVGRDLKTFKPLADDRCTRCAQRVVYLDDDINGEPLLRKR